MKNNLKRVAVALILAVALIVSVCPTIFAAEQNINYSTSSNSGERDEICTSLNGTGASSYYTGNYTYDKLAAQSSSALLNTLRTFMTSTHDVLTSYSQCSSLASTTDCENNNGRVTLIYTSYSAKQSDAGGGGSGWDREHVWPKSKGGFDKTKAGSDLHHIRPSDSKVNNTRSSLKYGNVNGGDAVQGNLSGTIGGYKSGSYFEPHDNVKGDVARICLYVYVRWGGEFSESNNINNVFQSVDVLLDWCELDPVDTWEMGRNVVVENIQGNRNVFIDYPELAWKLFGREVPSDMVTPSGKAQSGGSSTPTDPECQHANTELRNVKVANCGRTGYTGDTYCKDCNVKLSSGTTTPIYGEHAWGETNSSGWHTCGVCGTMESVGGTVIPPVTPPDDTPIDPSTCPHSETVVKNEVIGCTEMGYSGDVHCAACDKLLIKGTNTSPEGHAWRDLTEKLETCDRCGEARTKKASDVGMTVAIVGGSIGGVGVIGVVLFFIIRRRFI